MWIPHLATLSQTHPLPDRSQEMRTLVDALTRGGEGQVTALMYVLTHRLLALEAKGTGRSELARGLELVDTSPQGLASTLQLQSAGRKLIVYCRLDASIDSLRRPR